MRIMPIINRLRDQCDILQGRVEMINSLVSPDEQELDAGLPIAWVIPIGGMIEGNTQIKTLTQKRHFQFAVIIAAENTDESGTEPWAEAVESVNAALLGYQLQSDYTLVQLVSDELLDVSHRVIWWQCVYEYMYLLNKT